MFIYILFIYPVLQEGFVKLLLNLLNEFKFIMDITFASLIFASRTIPTDFGLIAAAIDGAGSLLFIALRFVPDASN